MIKSDIPPFEIYKNVFFVGSSRVSVHIIRTESGLVMIDTGYPDMYDQIIESMNQLGLLVEDISAIFHTHGHIDHFGCTQKLAKVSGAQTYISRIDNDIANGKLDLSCAKEVGYDNLPPFDCDVLVEDGDVFTFGDVTIRCRLTPGHTDGVMSFFITLKDGIIAAMHGGVGLNTLTGDFLTRYGLPFENREKFKRGLCSVKNEKVDIVLGNHPGQNDTPGKRKRVLEGESVTDSGEWERFLVDAENKLDLMINGEK